jgi:Bifunctional DNA primase/polymerase, N-terminal
MAGLPCQPGRKVPATPHGFYDATTDLGQITRWFTRQPGANLAIATGTPGPDVLDIDQHGPAGNGFAAYARLQQAGLLDGAILHVRTPSTGLHAYFTGSAQRNGHLAAHHVDFRSTGGYVLAPPSQIDGKPYRLLRRAAGQAGLDWDAVLQLLEPGREPRRPEPRQDPDRDLSGLARWVATQPEGNRNDGLFWAAHRALEANPAADLNPLAAAARQAGLDDPEITRTLDSVRRPYQPTSPDHHPEAAS